MIINRIKTKAAQTLFVIVIGLLGYIAYKGVKVEVSQHQTQHQYQNQSQNQMTITRVPFKNLESKVEEIHTCDDSLFSRSCNSAKSLINFSSKLSKESKTEVVGDSQPKIHSGHNPKKQQTKIYSEQMNINLFLSVLILKLN